MHDRWRRRLIGIQAVYYGITGLWSLVHLASFELVTGPKIDDWLVHMVGLLAAVIGMVLGLAAARNHGRSPEVVTLAAGSALAFAAIDLWYGLSGRISSVYLADAVLQFCLVAGFILTRKTSPEGLNGEG